MGDFHDVVTKLLGVFSCGISMMKANRKNESRPDSTSKRITAETHLSRSLKKHRLEVENAYGEDLVRYGPKFADGDAEAHSSLSKILYRLNAIIKRLTLGKTTATDYQVLLNLSNTSRIEAINTFERLSQRLSQSSLALVPLSPDLTERKQRRQHRQKRSPASSPKHARSKSAPELSVTSHGLVRPKAKSKQSSSKSASSSPKHRAKTPDSQSSQPPKQQRQSHQTKDQVFYPPQYTTSPAELLHQHREDRKSFMSFTSDSTKLGEIPPHKWANSAAMQEYPRAIYYPIEPYHEPEKPRSRLMKLLRR